MNDESSPWPLVLLLIAAIVAIYMFWVKPKSDWEERRLIGFK
jgi:hypothetical protein